MQTKRNTEGTHSAKRLLLNHSPLQARKRELGAPASSLCPKPGHSCRPHGAPHRPAKKETRSRGQASSWDCTGSGYRCQRELIWLFWVATEQFPSFPPSWKVGDLVTRGVILGKQMTTYWKTAVPSTSAGRLPTQFLKHSSMPLWLPAPPTTFYLESKGGSFYRSQPQVSSTHQEPQLAKN